VNFLVYNEVTSKRSHIVSYPNLISIMAKRLRASDSQRRAFDPRLGQCDD